MLENITGFYVAAALVGFFFTIAWLVACSVLDISPPTTRTRPHAQPLRVIIPLGIAIGAASWGAAGTLARRFATLPVRDELLLACACGIGMGLATRHIFALRWLAAPTSGSRRED